MRTTAIDRQLAGELEQLAEAQEAARKAADRLAQDPNNPQHRSAVVQAQQAVAEVQVGIDALNAARVEAAKFDQSETGKALRQARVKAVGAVVAGQDAVVKAATGVNQALANLLTCMQELADANGTAKNAALTYLDLNETDIATRMHDYEQLARLPSSLAHAVMLRLYEALKVSGIDYSNFITFNLFEVTPATGVGGDFERDMKTATQANAERIAKALEHIELIHTGCYVPPAADQLQAVPIQEGGHYIAKDFGDLMQHMGKSTDQQRDAGQVQTHTIAKDWTEYLEATTGLQTPENLHQ